LHGARRLGLIVVASSMAIDRGLATDEPAEEMVEDEAEGLETAK
jgi:hypothetical protein